MHLFPSIGKSMNHELSNSHGTVSKLKTDRSSCRCRSFPICATDLVLVTLDSLGPQRAVYQISFS
jgi:hypothetical protein